MAAKKASADKKPAEKEKPAKAAAEKSAKSGETAYVVFARRFRPRSFSDVVGQSPTTNALRQALNTGRIAQAYLFCGPRGVGKTSLARIVAKALNCLNGKGPNGVAEEPCNECEACESIQEGRSLDVIEMDAATNRGIEEVRSLRDNVGISPAELRYKVYIIDEVHMLTKEAWNAFLKTLEEPPAHVKFIFATTDPNNVPETILSRCQRYDLRRIGPADIVTRLKQICDLDKIEYEDSALSRIASLARGGLRDAEGLLDQAVNLGQGKVTDQTVRELSGAAPDELIFEILQNCAAGKTSDVLLKANQALEAGADPEDMLESITERLRGTLLSKVCGEDSALLQGQSHLKAPYAELSKVLSEDQLLMLIQVFSGARRQMRDAVQTRLPLEMALIRAARARELVDLGKLVSAIENNGPPRAVQQSSPPREGQRPNSPGRSVGSDDSRPAASNSEVQSAAPKSSVLVETPGASAGGTPIDADSWSKIMSLMAAEKGGALLKSALSHSQSATLDSSGAKLILGFSSEQLFYRDSMEKPQNQALLAGVLKRVFGKVMTVGTERVAAGAAPRVPVVSRPSPPALRPQPVQPVAEEISDEGFEETEIEIDTGELPLPAPVMSDESDAAPAIDEDAPPARTVKAPILAPTPKRPMPEATDASALKTYAEHPVVKMLIKETDGKIISVNRK